MNHLVFALNLFSLSLVFLFSTNLHADDTFVYPLMDAKLTSQFGKRKHPIYRVTRRHKGIDLAAPEGAPIRTISNGKVVFADPYAGYGKLIIVKHENGLTSHYGHLSKIKTTPGTKVKAGEIIGVVGSTGKVTGPHLHLEIRRDGNALDPLELFPGITVEAEG